MSAVVIRLAFGLMLPAAVGFSASAQDAVSLPDGQHLNPLDVVKLSDVRSFAERPLFAPARRPAVVEDAAEIKTGTPTESTPEFILLGVTSGPEGSVARIAKADGTGARSLRMGEAIDGWELRSVDASSVTIAQADKTIALTIFRSENGQDAGVNEEGSATGIVFGTEDSLDPPPAARVVNPN